MDLSRDEAERIVRELPKLELPYERKIHKKVRDTGLWTAVPKGRKYFLWFRHRGPRCVCIALQLGRHRKGISKVIPFVCCFDKLLCTGLGTILYGTIFTCSEVSFFSAEDLLLLKGANTRGKSPLRRTQMILATLRRHMGQLALGDRGLVVGTPLTARSQETLRKSCTCLPYELFALQFRSSRQGVPLLNERWQPSQRRQDREFIVRACLEADTYILSEPGGGEGERSYVCVPNYRTSVYMNSLFRRIKENENLDALEESDSEEEFEDTRADKFVDLEKRIRMRLTYMPRFKAWRPNVPASSAFKSGSGKKIVV